VDATGGGGWGPASTPTLLATANGASEGDRLGGHDADSAR
jgi:hypothetical protein